MRAVTSQKAADAVRAALYGNPPPSFASLARLAREAGPFAVDGLKVAVWEEALRCSSTETGELSFARLQSALFNPVRPGHPSLVEMMKSNGLMTCSDAKRTGEHIECFVQIEEAGATWADGLAVARELYADLIQAGPDSDEPEQEPQGNAMNPDGTCTGTTRAGSRCRRVDIHDNGRCRQHGGTGMLVNDRRWIERTRIKLQRILLRAAARGCRGGATRRLAQLLERYNTQ